MTQAPLAPVLSHPAFAQLSEDNRQRLERELQVLRFRPGQSLVDGRILPGQVHLVLQGECRLLGRERGRLDTLAKLGPGNFVGLASLLRAAPCEDVSAAGEVITASLPDQLVLDLYRQEEGFRRWCATTLWPAEVAALLVELQRHQPRSDLSLLRVLGQAVQEARLVDPTTLPFPSESSAGLRLLVASANCPAAPLCSRWEPHRAAPAAQPPFPLRLISLPEALLAQLAGDQEAAATVVGPQGKASPALADAPELPAVSHLELGAGNGLTDFRLVRGQGPVESTLACFQMLARQLKLPFRRDSIEKVLRDSLRRGQAPNLQLCGQLAASLGLHVIAARVPAAMGTRLQEASLLPWEHGFAVVIASNGRGLTLASPEHGRVQLSPEQLEQLFPEGIELLVMERSTLTPEQRFGPEWFWPALKRYRGVLLQVLLASFVVQLFTLANPLLIQVIIDKVISQRSL
ncbi:MAG: peptidase C39, partial [Prochlorococcaceae cyanobacterium]